MPEPEPVVAAAELPKALGEEIKAVAEKWSSIVSSATGPLKIYLTTAKPSVDEVHLLGYDHENGGLEAVKMREKEEAVLTKIGLKRNGSYYFDEE